MKSKLPRMVFGERVKQRRLELGLTQEVLANAVGSSINAISKLERGETKQPAADNLLPLARVLHVHPDWLISGKLPKAVLPPVVERVDVAMRAMSMQPFDLTDATGGLIAPDTVEMWLDGRAEPTDDQLALIAAPLGRTIGWLKTGVSEVKELTGMRVVYDARGEPAPDNLSQQEIDVIRDLRDMCGDQRETVVKMIKAAADMAREGKPKKGRRST